uniref:Uncharacterized protein n=1 Tax=Globisporangium ultimum (strain ATCC 200006 / CBS 805.95 / DAOM BR144) TaxID=431595 RepID=K3WXC9_GLOUD
MHKPTSSSVPMSTKGIVLYNNPPPAAMEVSNIDFEKIDMILESPHFEPQQTLFVNRRVLGTISVVTIIYLNIAGSPIGSEPVVSSTRPLIGLTGYVVFPVLFTIPFSYIVAELCSVFSEVLNGALLPGVIVKVITDFYGITIKSPIFAWAIKAVITILLSLPTFLGTRNVGRLSVMICTIVLVTFSIFSIWTGGVFVNTLCWNYDGLAMVSMFGGEISNPARVYPRAIMITTLLVMVSYIIPMPAGLASNDVH